MKMMIRKSDKNDLESLIPSPSPRKTGTVVKKQVVVDLESPRKKTGTVVKKQVVVDLESPGKKTGTVVKKGKEEDLAGTTTTTIKKKKEVEKKKKHVVIDLPIPIESPRIGKNAGQLEFMYNLKYNE